VKAGPTTDYTGRRTFENGALDTFYRHVRLPITLPKQARTLTRTLRTQGVLSEREWISAFRREGAVIVVALSRRSPNTYAIYLTPTPYEASS
jgi:hypothetical protein